LQFLFGGNFPPQKKDAWNKHWVSATFSRLWNALPAPLLRDPDLSVSDFRPMLKTALFCRRFRFMRARLCGSFLLIGVTELAVFFLLLFLIILRQVLRQMRLVVYFFIYLNIGGKGRKPLTCR